MAQIVTITNPLTGKPVQVDQLDHTAQEIDDATTRALAGGDLDQDIAKKMDATESADYPGCYYRMVDGVHEWINPPMVIGVEYRTTERYNGKPVYVKAIATGAMPSASGLSNRVVINTGILSSEVDSIVRWGGTVTNGGTVFTLPTSIGSNQVIELNGFTHPYNAYVVYVESSNDKSDYSGTIVFAYTKKADS